MQLKIKILLYTLFAFAIVTLSSCSSHFKTGMNAYTDGDYDTAVNELTQVKKEHEDFDLAMATLVKAEFKLALKAFKTATNPTESIGYLKKMVPLALKTKSKEFVNETLGEIMEKLKEAKDAALIKVLLVERLKLAFK